MSKEKNKTMTPKLRFPEFREAGEWEEKTIGCFFDFDKKPKKSEFFDKEKILTVKLHTQGVVKNERATLLTGGTNYFKRRAGEFIFSKIDLLNGAFGIVPKELDGYVSSTDVPAFSFTNNCDPTFFINWLRSNYSKLQVERTGTSNTLKRVSPEKFFGLTMFVPINIKEQQKIATTLSSLDDLIAAQSQKIKALQTHKKGLMQLLFPAEGERTPRARFGEFEDSGEWEIKALGKIANNLNNKRIPITESEREKGMIPYYGASGVIDYVKDFIFDETLLCISEDGANLVARTYPIAFSITGKTWVNNHAHVLKFKNLNTQILVENYLNSINLEEFLTGMAQPKLNRAKLDIIPIPLPKPMEQQKIAATLSSLDDLITTQTQKLEALKAHKRGLMQQLFPNPNHETL